MNYFNSIKVRLERIAFKASSLLDSHFNSIKVRLELTVAGPMLDTPTFQFHKGTIRTLKSGRNKYVLFHFNSIKVRLEHMAPNTDDGDDTISIP